MNQIRGFDSLPGADSLPSAPARAQAVSGSDLALYDMQKPLVERLMRRLTNTSFDILFYDVAAFAAAMFVRGAPMDGRIEGGNRSRSSQRLDLDAWSNPEGSILVVDAPAE